MINAVIIVILVLVVILAVKNSLKHFKGQGGCCGGGGDEPAKIREKKLKDPRLGELEVHISGMHCDHCAASVTKALNEIDGISARVNLKKNLAVVAYDREIQEDKITGAIENAGFHVTEIHKKLPA